MEITGAMIARSKHIGLSDPCVICGGKFGIEFNGKDTCEHTQDQVLAVLMRIKIMSPKRREAIMKGSARTVPPLTAQQMQDLRDLPEAGA